MQDPIITVVIPSLNRASLIGPTIDSVLGQDYPHIELIVVDGGSTDGTLALLESYDDALTWISEPDKGQSDAINKGWRMGRGAVLAWLNADDVWTTPDTARRVVAYFQQHPEVDVAYGKCGLIDEAGKQVGWCYVHPWDFSYAVEYQDNCLAQPATFMRRSIIREVGYLDTSVFAMDKDLWFRIGLVGSFGHIPELLAHARNTPGKCWDVLAVAEDSPRSAKKFFSLPGVPPNLLAKRKRAFSNSYVRAAALAYKGGFWKAACRYLYQAVAEDPTNLPTIMHRVMRAGMNFALRRTRFLGRV